jgi:hypothetical protein
MGLPGFSAGASLYKTTNSYHLAAAWGSNSGAPGPPAPGGYDTRGLVALFCPPWLTMCHGLCTDTTTDNSNCSRCGAVCANYYPQFPDCCNSACTNKNFDFLNCGDCGIECGDNQNCCSGVCTDLGTNDNCADCGKKCNWPTTTCCWNGTAYSCVDTQTDPNHCGDCGNPCVSGNCSKAHCCPKCTVWINPRQPPWFNPGCYSCTDIAKATGIPWTCCDAVNCTNTNTDPSNCGHCGNSCRWDQVCENGKCFCKQPGFTDCPDHECHDLQSDPDHCGHCGTRCGSDACCVFGLCQFIDFQTDPNNCGICGRKCLLGKACCLGQCTNVSLASLASDPNNCGTCGRRCNPGEICCAGECVDPKSDPRYCGNCLNSCVGGAKCCDGDCKNLQQDDSNCGSCGHDCVSMGYRCEFGQCIPPPP